MEIFQFTSTGLTRASSDRGDPAVSLEIRRFMFSKMLSTADVWYVYENKVALSNSHGCRKYVVCGAQQKCKTAPFHHEVDYGYVRIGLVDLLTGDILPC